MKLVLKLFANALAVLIAAYVVPNVTVDTFLTALIVAVILGILNAFIKPLLVVLTLPITIITLGLFTLVINTFLVIVTSNLVPGFEVYGWLYAFLFSIIVSLVSAFFGQLSD